MKMIKQTENQYHVNDFELPIEVIRWGNEWEAISYQLGDSVHERATADTPRKALNKLLNSYK